MDTRKIDQLISEHVFGYKLYDSLGCESSSKTIVLETQKELPHYSTQIQDAWLVVERMWEKGFGFNIAIMSEADYSKNTGWDAWFIKLETKEHFGSWLDGTSSAPMAICLASLKALGVENET